ncbi:MAG: penicillin-binding protein 1C [Campylobacterota bacterium]|nr:penicillin-binding protein 1C [Campylobacterota bacterium]
MKSAKIILSVTIALFLLFLLLNRLYPLDTYRIQKPKSTLIYDRNQQLMRVHLSEDGFLRIPLQKGEITKRMKQALFSYEDRYFYEHFGVNPFSVARALWFNLRNKRVIGASTLTMQLARMMHHKPRTIKNKLIELFMALQLEYAYSKEEILTLYLNNAPYGGNVEGFASASFIYFGLPVASLSLGQVAYLVSVPKNPNRNAPKNKKLIKRNIEKLKEKVLLSMYENEQISKEIFRRAKGEVLRPQRRDLPHFAPHLSAKLKIEGAIHTTLDLVLQQSLQGLVTQRVEELKALNINNGSAIVIENKTMQILAYIGSQNFNDKRHSGQVDGVNALFSPGSTLKPFVYAKALEMGLITPLKKLYDVPLYVGGYKPLNYNERFIGEVTAKEALQFSLNVPAVELDRLLGDDSLFSLLKQAEIKSINRPKSYYGLSLSLGGCGITLQDLAQLFALLANGGEYQKASYLLNKAEEKKKRILTNEATYLISKMLVDAPRSTFSSSWQYMQEIPMVAFKTGTSAHAKDLLTVGYTPEYTVAVWYGNFNATKSKKINGKGMTGLEAASPTLHAIFKLLQPKEGFVKPKGIVSKRICQDAIQIGACKSSVEDEVIQGVNSKVPCKLLRAEVLVKMIDHHTISSMEALKQHVCYQTWKSYKPLISNPINRQKYTQNRLLPQYLKKMSLQCYSFENNTTVHWLIDDEKPFIGKSGEKHYRYFTPGMHQIRCLDQGAKMQSIKIEVEEL